MKYSDSIWEDIKQELLTLFAAHEAVGLKGSMCLYTHPEQEVWRTKESGLQFWFTADKVDDAVAFIESHYNKGNLPNSTLLLNPIIHDVGKQGITPLGSGVIWTTGFALGVHRLVPEQQERAHALGALSGYFVRGENDKAGLKTVIFSDKAVPVTNNAWTVEGCEALYNVLDIPSPEYAPYYLLSGLTYLSKHGLYGHPSFASLTKTPHDLSTDEGRKAFVAANTVHHQNILDASTAWDAYDRHHSLYKKFGIDVEDIERNLRFYNLCARDIWLFDATGVRHTDADTSVGFEFIVDGWVPKGAVTVIGASGGTGKSSLAHNLAVKAAIDWKEDEPNPMWLNSRVNLDKCKGLVVYLSGEDGPAIVHSRAKVYDPEGRSDRLMVLRTDFGEEKDVAGFLQRLHKLPDVSLVVIDPARKYLTGDEEDAAVVSQFFEAIEEFAINRNAAMVVVHHLAKGARPKHVSEIYDLLRGSQVFIDRPRVVIGMYREGPYVVAGLAKNNIPPQLGMIQGERVFARVPDKLELVQLPGEQGMRLDATLSEEELEALQNSNG